MIALYKTAQGLQEFCLQRQWKFCFIGGLAVLRWGQIRVTKDVDMTLLTGFGGEETYVDQVIERYRLRPVCSRDFALANRVLLVEDKEGIPVDIALGAIPFEERAIERSSLWEAENGLFLRTCSAEDLVVHKCFANRDIDWSDVENILARQGRVLNLEQVREELRPLAVLKPEAPILESLERKIGRQARPFTKTNAVNPGSERS
jgi:hypothetical protein